ncbi:hypothetical protein [Bosea sp. UNC402CLCol]|uniref:hypothetical protein n=1 Tax=Bosea sp. UNC402CLCol TaxID=1510531 RepID=UPI00056F80F3|nr:hypothetical protein [Bosea sp. UNC402CLCol]
MRLELTAPTTFYVDSSSGNDATGDGSMALPWASLAKAAQWTRDNVDLRGNQLKIKLAAGDYASAWIAGPWVGFADPDSVLIEGDLAAPYSCRINAASGGNALDAAYGARFTLAGVKVTSAYGAGIYSHEGSWVAYHHVEFGACPNGPHLAASKGGSTFDLGDIRISGWATAHLYASDTGEAFSTTGNTDLVGIPYFSAAFAWANFGGNVTSHTKTFNGAAAGKRFWASNRGIIGCASRNTFPGSEPGGMDATGFFLSGDGS